MEYAPDLIADLAQPGTRVFQAAGERCRASSQTPMTIAEVETGWRELLREIGAQTLSLCPSSGGSTPVASGRVHMAARCTINGNMRRTVKQGLSRLAQRRVERRVCSARHSRQLSDNLCVHTPRMRMCSPV